MHVSAAPLATPQRPAVASEALTQRARASSHRVIVSLKNVPAGPAHKSTIAAAQRRFLSQIRGLGVTVERTFPLTPQLVLTVSDRALKALRQRGDISVAVDGLSRPTGSGLSRPQ